MVSPSTSGRPPKTDRHTWSLSTTPGVVSRRASAAMKPRPITGPTPSVSNSDGVAVAAVRRSGPLAVRAFTEVVVNAAIAAKLREPRRQSS